jgi:hypothetical protein
MTTLPMYFDKPIEPRIRSLVDAMNATGVMQTIASCEGHRRRAMPPYVYFRASPEVAGAVCRHLREAQTNGCLHNCWEVEGLFDDLCRLCYRLAAPSLENTVFWRKRCLHADFEMLRLLMVELGREIRQYSEITVQQRNDENDKEGHPTQHITAMALQCRPAYAASHAFFRTGTHLMVAFTASDECHGKVPSIKKIRQHLGECTHAHL